ncbi:MAG: TIGR02266 family protein [Kofleriaceae bacterium]
MADPNTRQGKRTPVTLKIKFKSETLEQFIERYAVDVSQGGIFIRTKEPLAVGTQMKFEFQLRDASPLIAGEGTVVWTRENDPSRPAIAPGMGVRFDRLADGSQSVLEKILAEKAKQAPQRGQPETTKPPMFTDTPTRVAPAPVQEALLGGKSGRSRADSQETPLPKPMPFHSDADEFGAEAFEEATKVRALDELVAQTAAAEGAELTSNPVAPSSTPATAAAGDDLATRRRESGPPKELADLERDSAPGLPSPPESGNTGRTGKLLDTSPSPRDEQAPARTSSPSVQPPVEGARTRLGVEPAKAQTGGRSVPTDRLPSQRTAVAAEAGEPAPQRPSSAPIVIGIVFTVAVAAAAFWYFVLREHVADEVANQNPVTNPSGSALGSGSATPELGSGSAIAMTGSNGSAATAAPQAPIVETEIASNVAKATVTVIDTDQSGTAPFKAQLEKDKPYKIKVDAPGYVSTTLDVNGGQDKVTAKLVAKPRVVSVASEPPGGLIYVDGVSTGKRTPADVVLSTAQGARKQVRIQVRLAGYRLADRVIDPNTMQDGDTSVTASVNAKLIVVPAAVNTFNGGTHTQAGSGNGNGSANGSGSGTGTGSGSASTVTPIEGGTGSATPSTTGTGSASTTSPGASTGSATPPTPSEKSATGSGDPEPDWSKKTP